jgi:hypothetical protein
VRGVLWPGRALVKHGIAKKHPACEKTFQSGRTEREMRAKLSLKNARHNPKHGKKKPPRRAAL